MRRRERGGVESVVGPGLVALSLGVLAVGALLSPGEPVQYAMVQTNPVPAAKPLLDTSGIAEIQTIPVGESRLYYPKEVVDDVIEEFGEEAKDFSI